jgi:hypothetical protein
MFRSLPEYVVFMGGTYYARCDHAGEKVRIPRKVFSDLPADTKAAFLLLKPFSFVDMHSSPAVSAPSGKRPPNHSKPPKPPDKPAKSRPVLAASSVGLSPHTAGSVPETAPPSGPMMAYDPRFVASYDPRHFMYGPSSFGPQAVQYDASSAPRVQFLPPDPRRHVVYSASDTYASHRAPVQFQDPPQVFFASPMQHQLSQHSGARSGFPDGSGGGFHASGGGSSQVADSGYQGSSHPASQRASHSGKLLLAPGAPEGVPWR